MTPKTDLQTFLDAAGLGQYLDAMQAEDIDLATLPDLDDDDLRELGLTMGHRKALKKALGERTTGSAASDGPRDEQRRQVTVFFCDLVGSTELSGRYDAEDMSDILDRYHRYCERVITSHGGLNLGTQGDGVVACFGFPKAAEDDAERAVAAALAISAGVPALDFDDGLVLHTRIGVTTGRVFVRGDAPDSSALVGDSMNLASRLQDCAPVDSVVTGLNTRRLIQRSADMTFLDERQLKGFEDPVRIWIIDRLRDRADRGRTRDLTEATLLGRETEFAALRDLWAAAKTGRGQAVIVSGEAGIGKSHLIDALRDLAQGDNAQVIRYFCAPGYENSALYPVRSSIERMIRLRDAVDGTDAVNRVRRLAGDDDPMALRLWADLLSVDPGPAAPPLDMTAAGQKQATLAALIGQVQAVAAQAPVMVLLEDAHWADPTTLELLSAFVTGGLSEHPILLVATQRPGSALAWGELDHVTHITLSRLTPRDCRDLVARVMEDQRCPPDVVHKIVEAADGVPLFVEELSRSVLDQSDRANGSFATVTVPITLEDSLRARIDGLSRSKPIVQTAAVFGRRFLRPAVREILDMPGEAFDTALAEPVEARILLPESSASDASMLFRHALVHQAAYEGIARKQRQQLHARIATKLLEEEPDLATREPETLARHFAGAGAFETAIQYLLAAGMKATASAAQVEAANYYFRALEHLEKLPEGRARDEQEVLLRALLGGALMATRGFAAPEVYDAFARARELCQSLGDSPMYCSCLYGLFTVEASRSNRDAALALADELLTTFGEVPVPSWAIAAHFSAGVAAFFEGRLDDAEARFDHVLSLYSTDQHAALVEQFGDDLAEFSMCYRHWLHMFRGEIDKSAEILSRAETLARELNNKNAQTRSAAFRMGRTMELGDATEVARAAPKLIEIATAQGYPYWACAGQIGLGWSMAKAGQADGTAPIAGSLGFFDMIGQRNPQSYWRSYMVEALTALGLRDEAIAAADAALDMARTGLDRVFEPINLVRRAEARMIAPADPAAAEADLRAALEISERIGAHYITFLAALALDKVLAGTAQGDAARAGLAAATDRLHSSEPFAALQEAHARLAHA